MQHPPKAPPGRPISQTRWSAAITALSQGRFVYFGRSGRFEAGAGRIDFRIGSSSGDIRLTGSLRLSASVISAAPGAALVTRVEFERA